MQTIRNPNPNAEAVQSLNESASLPERSPVSPEETAGRSIETASSLRLRIPLSEKAQATVEQTRAEISAILRGADRQRLLVVCGPCSIDDVNAALEYAERLRSLAREVKDHVLVVMRTYFEKPRSVVGWKGMLYDPLRGSEAGPNGGLTIARRLAVRINEIGLPCATEFLNPLLAHYLEDCIAYGSIGSRTVESQIHRELASSLPMPIGLKNGMDGDARSALNAVRSARLPHVCFGQNLRGQPSLIETKGNRLAHVVLRGGASGPNCSEQIVAAVASQTQELGLKRGVVIDCSHGNSQKDHTKQSGVATEALRQFKAGQQGIAGIMLESYLREGRQDIQSGGARRFGQSITDSCIGWKDTERLIRELAEGL